MYDMKPYLETIDKVIAQGPYEESTAFRALAANGIPAICT